MNLKNSETFVRINKLIRKMRILKEETAAVVIDIQEKTVTSYL